MYQTWPIGRDRLDRYTGKECESARHILQLRAFLPMQDVQKITSNSFAVFSNLVLVEIPLKSHNKLISILLDDEANKLLSQSEPIFRIFLDGTIPA